MVKPGDWNGSRAAASDRFVGLAPSECALRPPHDHPDHLRRREQAVAAGRSHPTPVGPAAELAALDRCAAYAEVVKIADLQRFVALAHNGLHFPQTAQARRVPLASLYSSIDRLEAEVGHSLINRDSSPWTLTGAGALLLDEATRRIAGVPDADANPSQPTGGKAKAAKGKGRAPIVKGQPKPFKKRQGR